jgi:hypothetical protein
MKKITADILRKEDLTIDDAEKYVEWAFRVKEKTNFDPTILYYPRTVLCRAKADDEPIVYLPLQPILMFESLAPEKNVTERQLALALWKINEAVDKMGLAAGFKESYFLTGDEREANVCSLHGWTIILHDPERKIWMLKHRIGLAPEIEGSSLSETKVEPKQAIQ